ncbi:MAG: ABC transporter permease [Symbiobacterium sp.]|uniref:ABC transporter permease n=1 Tax=Symbiobacterium sp. TaxID=1971213 RepID=UPI00346423EB
MGRYLFKRLLNTIPLLILATLLSFALMQMAPGGPENILLSAEDARIDPSRAAVLRERWGLDDPIPVQYVRWLGNVIRGDFGNSYFYRRPVSEVIGAALPATIQLQAAAIILTYLIALPLGVLSAVRRRSRIDRAVTGLAFAAQAAPSFWVAILLIWGVARNADGLIPTHGIATPGVDLETCGLLAVLADRARHMVLPVTVLVFGNLTSLTRYMRSSMLEALREDYIRTARAKGLPGKVVVYRHALRNALLPVVALSGGVLASLVGGSVITETIFAWPGIGRVSHDAAVQRDYTVSMAILLISGVLTLIGFLLVDLAYVWVDPRIRYD